MRKFAYIAIATICSSPAIASDGHNGIRFDMTQKQVEAKGFVCNPPEEKKPDVVAECQHMDMTGVAFGLPTKDYRILIGPTKKVDMIGAEFSGRLGTDDYFSLHHKKLSISSPRKMKLALSTSKAWRVEMSGEPTTMRLQFCS